MRVYLRLGVLFFGVLRSLGKLTRLVKCLSLESGPWLEKGLHDGRRGHEIHRLDAFGIDISCHVLHCNNKWGGGGVSTLHSRGNFDAWVRTLSVPLIAGSL